MAIPQSGRFSAQSIKRYIAQAKADNVGQAVTAKLALVAKPGNKALVFTGQVAITVGGSLPIRYDVANANSGKVQNFTNVDDAVKVMAVILPASDGVYTVDVGTGANLDAAIPADLVKANAALKLRLQAQSTKVGAAIVAADAQLALMVGWETGNSLQIAKKVEVTAQRAALADLSAALTAQIATL